MTDENPYTPPVNPPSDSSSQPLPKKERRIVRVLAAFLSLCCLTLPLGADYARLDFSLFAAVLMSAYAAFRFRLPVSHWLFVFAKAPIPLELWAEPYPVEFATPTTNKPPSARKKRRLGDGNHS